MKERRKFARCAVKEKTALKETDGRGQEASVLDVGLGGMKILLNKEIKAGTRIRGQFKILPHSGPFFVDAEVVWTKGCLTGAKFVKVSTLSLG